MGIPLLEIGIRSFSAEEAEFMKTKPNVAVIWAYQLARGNVTIHGNDSANIRTSQSIWMPSIPVKCLQ